MRPRRIIDYVVLAGLIAGSVFAIRYFGFSLSDSSVIVIDGDSLRIDERDIRLYGIDAPELHQTCKSASGETYRCGRKAKTFLTRLVAGRNVVCSTIDADRFGRDIAVCKADDVELNAAMVKNGWAVAYLRHSLNYAKLERQARTAKSGIWQGNFTEPEDWRADNK